MTVTDDNVVVGVVADDLFDFLCSSLSGRKDPGGVTVGVVEVQNVYDDIVPEAWLAEHRGSIPEVTYNRTSKISNMRRTGQNRRLISTGINQK